MLLLADSGFYSFELFGRFAATGTDLAWRVGASVSLGLVRWLPDGSYLALIYRPGLSAERNLSRSVRPTGIKQPRSAGRSGRWRVGVD